MQACSRLVHVSASGNVSFLLFCNMQVDCRRMERSPSSDNILESELAKQAAADTLQHQLSQEQQDLIKAEYADITTPTEQEQEQVESQGLVKETCRGPCAGADSPYVGVAKVPGRTRWVTGRELVPSDRCCCGCCSDLQMRQRGLVEAADHLHSVARCVAARNAMLLCPSFILPRA